MRTVGTNSRMGAGGTFHGGGLATDALNSPHLLIPEMDASMLICVAANDDENEPEVKNILRQSFAAAGVPAEIEVYEGTLHGWCPPDSAVYHEAQAERAWSRLLNLFENALA
jgi:carboxymethylenebutenolidase